ncbi:hypothetical protein FHR59_000215 [Xanthomonas arboricola]|uniref:hypothetical protein n=1 Tax=Xanthomonas arboricola TaxID=56448 RepID=UPI00161685D1|nr:hypothetical protein [Xanthomonas arboricola]MBB6336005.1 hypothetical protein [Xanthomonas arboricola]
MQVVEVLQDGAAVVNESSVLGIYTRSIATCAGYVFYGRDGFALIHDTGQLAIPSMVEVARKCGPLNKTFLVYNPLKESKSQKSSHRDRLARIRGALNLKNAPIKVPTTSGDAFFLRDGNHGTMLSALSELISTIPNRDQRLCINELNNLFASRNAQSLPVDLQFFDGAYRPLPSLLWRIEDMISRADAELRGGDGDYHAYLKKAQHLGIL